MCISPQLSNHGNHVSSAGGRAQVFSTGSGDPGVAIGNDVESERNRSAEGVVIESERIEADEEVRHLMLRSVPKNIIRINTRSHSKR